MHKISYIQALRALAVFIVIGNHYKQAIDLFKYGYLGVDLFFVICGYIMVYTTVKCDGSWAYVKTFLIKRFSRIWPVYMVLSVLYFLIFGGINGWSINDNLMLLFKSVIFYPYWQIQPIINAGWTLPFEVFFYLAFAVTLRAGRYRWIANCAIAFFTLIICNYQFIRSYGSFDGFGAYIFMITEHINWCFYIGVIVGFISIKGIRFPAWIYETALYSSAFLFFIFLTSIEQPQHGFSIGIIFGFMLFSLEGINSRSEIHIPRSVTRLGDMSFSLYLCHEFVVQFFILYVDKYKTDIFMRVILFFPYIALSVVLGWLSWKYLENGLAVKVRDVLLGKLKRGISYPAMTK